MQKNKPIASWLIPGALVFIAGFAAATMYDLTINQALFNPSQPFAVTMEALGWYPAFVPVLFLLMLGAKPRRKSVLTYTVNIACGVLLAVFSAYLFYRSYADFAARQVLHAFLEPGTVLLLALGVALLLAGLLAAFRLRGKALRVATVLCTWGTVYALANQVAVYGLKMLWQRTRFDDMVVAGTFDKFTPWYLPFGNGGSSFPSGHTANAAGIFVLIMLCDALPALNRYRGRLYAFCWGYTALMAASRVVIGRHFLSDTLAAALIMALLLLLIRRLPLYRYTMIDVQSQPEQEL